MGVLKKKKEKHIRGGREWDSKKKIVAVDILLVYTFKLSEWKS